MSIDYFLFLYNKNVNIYYLIFDIFDLIKKIKRIHPTFFFFLCTRIEMSQLKQEKKKKRPCFSLLLFIRMIEISLSQV